MEKKSDKEEILNAIASIKKDLDNKIDNMQDKMKLWTLKVMGTLVVGTGGLVVTLLKLYPNVVHVTG